MGKWQREQKRRGGGEERERERERERGNTAYFLTMKVPLLNAVTEFSVCITSHKKCMDQLYIYLLLSLSSTRY